MAPAQKRSWFELAPARRIPIDKLVAAPDDSVARLLIRLAAAFNDLKSIEMAVELLREHGVPTAIEHKGEFSGVIVHCVRMSGGIMQNVLEIIRAEATAVDSDEVRDALTHVPRESKDGWIELVQEARVANTQKTVTGLKATRNKSAFHYDAEIVAACVRAFSIKGNGVGAPAYSDGTTMQETRFYFADAALERLGADHVQADHEALRSEIRARCDLANIVLKPLLVALLDARAR